jgi:hypothetical protein
MPIGQLTHDWMANAGEWSFGMQEFYWAPIPYIVTEHRVTVIYVGPVHCTVDYSAPVVLSTFIASSVFVVFVISHFFAKFSQSRGGPP